MKAFTFISLFTLAAALPTNGAVENTEHQLYARDPQRGFRGGGGFGRGFGGGFGGLGGLLGGLEGLVSVPLDIVGGLAGGLVGPFLPFRMVADGTGEVVDSWADANAYIPNPAYTPPAAQ